tara:strand:+ start:902 stop:2572 length:1671 start_codon:yes stop_codon:yes gene_type:complete
MAFDNQNQLIIKHEDVYYNRRKKDGDGNYARELEPGNYQFVTLQTVMDQFLISYVGKDKIIPTVNKLDVQFHALRGLQEFSYDILRSHKGFEFTLPNKLSVILPQDYVAYTQVSWSDSSGVKHPIYYTHDTSNPRNPYQTPDDSLHGEDNPFALHAMGTFTAGSSVIELDGLYPQLFTGVTGTTHVYVKEVNPGLFDPAIGGGPTEGGVAFTMPSFKGCFVYAVWHDQTTGKTSIQLNSPNNGPNANNLQIAPSVSGKGHLEFYWGDVKSTPFDPNKANTFNLIPELRLPVLFNPVFSATSNKITAPNANDIADIRIGMKVSCSNEFFGTGNQRIRDIDYEAGILYMEPSRQSGSHDTNVGVGVGFPFFASTVAPTGTSFTTVPSISFYDEDMLAKNSPRINAGPYMYEESDTLSNFKGTGNSDDSNDDEIRSFSGARFGLDSQRANINGTFYIDQTKGVMRFSSNLVGKTIVIDYVSDSVGQKREQIVHKFAEEAIYKWIAHAILATRSNTPEYLVQRFKKERFAEMRKAKLRLQNINFKEFTQLLRGKSKQIKH